MKFTDVICPFCGCLCDDAEIEVEDNSVKSIENTCELGTAKFSTVHGVVTPLKKGEEISIEESIAEIADVLSSSNKPLLYGWSSTNADAISAGIMLAERIRGVIDHTSSVCHGPSIVAEQSSGMVSSTLGEILNYSDLIIYWGCNPMEAHPRHMSRYTSFPRGIYREEGRRDRYSVAIDVRKSDTAKVCSNFLKINSNQDFELVSALRLAIKEKPIPEIVAGIHREEIEKLADRMKSCEFGVIFFGLGLTMSEGKFRNIDNALNLVKELNDHTHFVIMPMRGHYNVKGAGEVFTWQTGYPFGVDFTRGYPRYNPGETTAVDLLVNEEVDSMLVVASDPVAHFPGDAVRYMKKIPVFVIDPTSSLTSRISRIYIPSAISGLETGGTAYRMDGVPLSMKKLIDPPKGILSDKEILTRIIGKV